MPYYRLYHLNTYTGHIDRAEEMFAADDVTAMYELQQRHCDHPLEIWDMARKVGRVDGVPNAAAFVPASATHG
jgi:hypothetical protein